MTLEILKFQLKIEKVELAQIQGRSERGSRNWKKMGELVKELCAVPTPMPEPAVLVPARLRALRL